MDLNSHSGKQLLALIRDSDYAHAGEEEAIEITLRPYPKRPDQFLLDVGCGRGGTAAYVQEQGWGRVVGLDREADSIVRARQVYPAIELHACDVVGATAMIDRRFDVIYLLNSFYAFDDQPRALAALRQLAREPGQLVIFDYTDRGGYGDKPLLCEGEPFLPHPLKLSTIGDMLRQAGWQLLEVEDLTAAYERWYAALLERMDRKRTAICHVVGDEGFAFVRDQYAGLLGAIRDGRLGGAIVRAISVSGSG